MKQVSVLMQIANNERKGTNYILYIQESCRYFNYTFMHKTLFSCLMCRFYIKYIIFVAEFIILTYNVNI